MRENPDATKKVSEPTDRLRNRVITKSLDSIPVAAAMNNMTSTARMMSRVLQARLGQMS